MSRQAGMRTARSTPATFARVAPMFTALGDPTRLQLVSRLCDEGPLSISRLTAGTPLTRQAVTKHLRVLEGAGLATVARDGREQRWQVDPRRLADTRRQLARIAAQWDGALARLTRHVTADR
jgi:DNA-binding transcriptional ArsR family regulator